MACPCSIVRGGFPIRRIDRPQRLSRPGPGQGQSADHRFIACLSGQVRGEPPLPIGRDQGRPKLPQDADHRCTIHSRTSEVRGGPLKLVGRAQRLSRPGRVQEAEHICTAILSRVVRKGFPVRIGRAQRHPMRRQDAEHLYMAIDSGSDRGRMPTHIDRAQRHLIRHQDGDHRCMAFPSGAVHESIPARIGRAQRHPKRRQDGEHLCTAFQSGAVRGGIPFRIGRVKRNLKRRQDREHIYMAFPSGAVRGGVPIRIGRAQIHPMFVQDGEHFSVAQASRQRGQRTAILVAQATQHQTRQPKPSQRGPQAILIALLDSLKQPAQARFLSSKINGAAPLSTRPRESCWWGCCRWATGCGSCRTGTSDCAREPGCADHSVRPGSLELISMAVDREFLS